MWTRYRRIWSLLDSDATLVEQCLHFVARNQSLGVVSHLSLPSATGVVSHLSLPPATGARETVPYICVGSGAEIAVVNSLAASCLTEDVATAESNGMKSESCWIKLKMNFTCKIQQLRNFTPKINPGHPARLALPAHTNPYHRNIFLPDRAANARSWSHNRAGLERLGRGE